MLNPVTHTQRKAFLKRIIAAIFVGLLAVGLMYALASKHRYSGAFQFACRQIYLKHYLGSEALAEWFQKCMADRSRVQSSMNPEKVADILRQRFAELESSHLEIYSPEDDNLVWSGKSVGDNGIRTRGIDGRIVIHKIIANSSAEKAGVKPGDVVVSVYGEKAFGAYPYNEVNGDMTVRRGEKELPFKVEATPLQIDFSPQLKELAPDVGLLEISSFRKEYFVGEEWSRLADNLQDYPSIIVDLRGNLGGDFNAVIKALSFFDCEKADFGYLDRPAAVGEPDLIFKENSTEDEFYEQLTSSKRLNLKRFNGPCFNGALTILIDEDTASVSEIFAAVLKGRRQTRVWGARTRGDMLLGVWYPLQALGAGYTLSIPEAMYMAPGGEIIEGKGVLPTKALFYKYDDAIRGRDSWISAAMSAY